MSGGILSRPFKSRKLWFSAGLTAILLVWAADFAPAMAAAPIPPKKPSVAGKAPSSAAASTAAPAAAAGGRSVMAASVSGQTMNAAQRAATVQGIRAVAAGEWTRGRNLLLGTKDPLARTIFDWMAYTREYGKPDFNEIAHFIRNHPDWPRQGRLQLAAEKAMPRDMPYAQVTAWFDHNPPQTPDGVAQYLRALLAQRKTTAAQQVMRGYWPQASLSGDQQARFIRDFSNLIDTNLHAVRINALIQRKQYTNARAIGNRLGRGYPELVEARIALAEGAAGVDGVVARVPAHLKDDAGLLYERLRYRRRKDMDAGAIEMLHRQPAPDRVPNLQAWWTERQIMIRRLMDKKQYRSAYLIAANHKQPEGVPFVEAEFLAGWIALRHINEPWKAFEHFEKLYKGSATPISKSRGAYWAARASEALGHADIATQWYRVAARHQTVFYGQMAIGALSAEHKPPQQVPPERTVRGEAAFLANGLTQTARLMHEAGRWDETTQFLDALAASTQTPETVMLAAELAKKLDHHHNAVRIARRAQRDNIMIMDYAYPTLLQYMRNVDVEWALVHGLIRQESGFDMRARSSVGASGLMQLMPATAAETAKRAGIPHQHEWLATRPEHNIRLGTMYLAQMLRRYDGNYAIALAAYNAGPGRADRWLRQYGDPRKGEIDLVDWIENIPYSETRSYVQRVLESVYIYRLKLRDVQKSANSPIHVNIGPRG